MKLEMPGWVSMSDDDVITEDCGLISFSRGRNLIVRFGGYENHPAIGRTVGKDRQDSKIMRERYVRPDFSVLPTGYRWAKTGDQIEATDRWIDIGGDGKTRAPDIGYTTYGSDSPTGGPLGTFGYTKLIHTRVILANRPVDPYRGCGKRDQSGLQTAAQRAYDKNKLDDWRTRPQFNEAPSVGISARSDHTLTIYGPDGSGDDVA